MKAATPMRAVILAAGRGRRMKGLTDDRPKCLIPFRGRTLLAWQLAALRGAGISDIGIVTGYRSDMLRGQGLAEFHNTRWTETQMVSSLACAEPWLRIGNCIVSYSDIYYEPEAVRLLVESAADLAITYDPNWRALWERRFGDPLLDAETFRLRADGTLAEIGGKPGSVDEIEGQYMGLLRFTPRGWSEVARLRENMNATERDAMHMTGTLQRVIEAGRVPVHAVPYGAGWGEFDTDQDLRSAGEA